MVSKLHPSKKNRYQLKRSIYLILCFFIFIIFIIPLLFLLVFNLGIKPVSYTMYRHNAEVPDLSGLELKI